MFGIPNLGTPHVSKNVWISGTFPLNYDFSGEVRSGIQGFLLPIGDIDTMLEKLHLSLTKMMDININMYNIYTDIHIYMCVCVSFSHQTPFIGDRCIGAGMGFWCWRTFGSDSLSVRWITWPSLRFRRKIQQSRTQWIQSNPFPLYNVKQPSPKSGTKEVTFI